MTRNKKENLQKTIQRIVFLLPLAYIISSYLFPYIFFNHKTKYDTYTIYYNSNKDESKKIDSIFDKVKVYLQNSNISNNGNQSVFLCSSHLLFGYFALNSFAAFAINRGIDNRIFLSKSDIKREVIVSNRNKYNKSLIAQTITHEVVHSIIRNKFGFVKSLFIEKWKQEGYCDYVASRCSFGFQNGINLLKSGNRINDPSFEYFLYHLYIMYLINNKAMSFEDIVREDYDIKELNTEIIQNIKNGSFKPSMVN